MKKILICLCLACFVFSGCVSYKKALSLDRNYMKRRQQESRYFDTTDGELLVCAATQLLQDMDYILKAGDVDLGFIAASKLLEGSSDGEKAAVVILAALGGTQAVYAESQEIVVAVVIQKSVNREGHVVRAEFAREITANTGQKQYQKINDDEIYRTFFDRLAQSLFLTAHEI